MRLPRDISGNQLIKALKKYGYEVTRQSGSHIRLSTQSNGEHHITVPNHDPLKIGTLNGILSEIATHLGKNKGTFIEELFN
ncbi:MAG: type II toxin-antitoxin system HicA family toxin [Bacteroidia bacterium]|nr:type II toxin-antitoxin system HicA family toxin [Bacteroidia bacterium]